jgi:hypothetical protein
LGIGIDPGICIENTRSICIIRYKRTVAIGGKRLFFSEFYISPIITEDICSIVWECRIDDMEDGRILRSEHHFCPLFFSRIPGKSDITRPSLCEIDRGPTDSCYDIIGTDRVASGHREDASPDLSIFEEDTCHLLPTPIFSDIHGYGRITIEAEERIIGEDNRRFSSSRGIDDITTLDDKREGRNTSICAISTINPYSSTSSNDTTQICEDYWVFEGTDRIPTRINRPKDISRRTGSSIFHISRRRGSEEFLCILDCTIPQVIFEIHRREYFRQDSSDTPIHFWYSRKLLSIRKKIRYECVDDSSSDENHY